MKNCRARFGATPRFLDTSYGWWLKSGQPVEVGSYPIIYRVLYIYIYDRWISEPSTVVFVCPKKKSNRIGSPTKKFTPFLPKHEKSRYGFYHSTHTVYEFSSIGDPIASFPCFFLCVLTPMPMGGCGIGTICHQPELSKLWSLMITLFFCGWGGHQNLDRCFLWFLITFNPTSQKNTSTV